MRNILLTVSYDGTDFCGWQRQDSGEIKNSSRTVQGEIEIALEKLHKQPVTLYASPRSNNKKFFITVNGICRRSK